MKCNFILKIPFFGKKIFKFIVKKEGGEKFSKTLRKYFCSHNIIVDMYSYGGCFNQQFNISGKVKIGKYCSIGQNVCYLGANHPLDYISTTPFFYNKEWSGFEVKDIQRNTLNIGNDVWIGYGTIITSKCTSIGNGAVIGAGSIVTKDVPPYAIVAGNPAKIIKYRFSEEERQLLEKSSWWEFTPQELIKFYDYIKSPTKFVENLKLYQKNKKR